MSKKNLVKKVIDGLIQEGSDFADLTQSALTGMEGLEDVSKTTIKRAKKEYKREKVVNRQDYREQNIKRKIYKYLDRRPKSSLADLREALPDIPPAKVSEYHLYWKKKQEKVLQKDTVKKPGVNPRKLKELVSSYLDSDNSATAETLYKQFPEAKQSSVYSYFSGWKRKQKSTDRVKKGGLFEVIFKFLDSKPESTIDEIKAAFSDVPIRSIEIYQNLWLKELEDKKAKTVSIDDVVQEFIGLNNVINSRETSGKNGGLPNQQQARKNSLPVVAQVPAKRRGRPPRISDERKMSMTARSDAAVGKKEKIDTENVVVNNEAREKNSYTGVLGNSNVKLIQALKRTIEKNKTTIANLEKERQQLKQKEFSIISEMNPLKSDQIENVREFVKIYVKGLQKV